MFKKLKDILVGLESFFPINLLLLNFKKNQILLVFWLLLIGMVSGKVGAGLGVPYLFLDPEYMGKTSSFWAMFIVGTSFALFSIAYYITCYILDSHRFNFLSTIRYPFIHYSINNSFFPITFLFFYVVNFWRFKSLNDSGTDSTIVLELVVFVSAYLAVNSLFFLYFGSTNKDHTSPWVSSIDDKLKRHRINAKSVIKKLKGAQKGQFQIRYYLSFPSIFKKVNEERWLNKEVFTKIIDQNHLNAVVVELVVFLLIFSTGFFRDYEVFQIPASASAMLLLGFLVMFTGAFSYWLRGWAISSLIILIVVVNWFFKNEILRSSYEAFGIDYTQESVLYTNERLNEINHPKIVKKDLTHTIQILNNWKAKFPEGYKPKMVFVCASGGGQRSAYWTMNTLQEIDKKTKGNMFKHTMMYTGASGGLIGTAYYRELKYQQFLGLLNSEANSRCYLENLGKDLLNPILFSMVVSDIFFRYQKFDFKGFKYYKGRGYAFEKKFNINTNWVLNRTINEYRAPEFKAEIPLLVIAPTIINDGRKLYISPQPFSYMNVNSSGSVFHKTPQLKGVEFGRLFKDRNADSLSVVSALRMSATFPYVTPNVQLPSSPVMEIMDAGLADNFGVSDAVRFISTFSNWIDENTSGVILVSIRDSDKNSQIAQKPSQGILTKVFNPIKSVYTNWGNLQDFNNDHLVELLADEMQQPVKFINFEYIPKANDNWSFVFEKDVDRRASLSWHLTEKEKQSIRNAFYYQNNQKALEELSSLISN